MKTIFLDRDGVINENFGFVSKWSDFKFIDGSVEALQLLTKKNYKIIIVTNQSGIARGYYTVNDFEALTENFSNFCFHNNIQILETLFCPHHKDGVVQAYKKDCYNRKPNPGMFLKASEMYNLNLSEATMVGDSETDIVASSNAGIKKNFLVNTSLSYKVLKLNLKFKIKKNLLEVTKEILS